MYKLYGWAFGSGLFFGALGVAFKRCDTVYLD